VGRSNSTSATASNPCDRRKRIRCRTPSTRRSTSTACPCTTGRPARRCSGCPFDAAFPRRGHQRHQDRAPNTADERPPRADHRHRVMRPRSDPQPVPRRQGLGRLPAPPQRAPPPRAAISHHRVRTSSPSPPDVDPRRLRRTHVLGGLINEYRYAGLTCCDDFSSGTGSGPSDRAGRARGVRAQRGLSHPGRIGRGSSPRPPHPRCAALRADS
jgi:hypothetical protein